MPCFQDKQNSKAATSQKVLDLKEENFQITMRRHELESQLHDLHLSDSEREIKASRLRFKIREVKQRASIKQAGVRLLEAELEAMKGGD